MKTERLKEATKDLHQQVEEENLARFIMDHSMDVETYKLLLLQNFLAYQKTENAIAPFIKGYQGQKHKQLQKDLEQLKISKFAPEFEFSCNSRAEAFGAAYVVEGSALGGMVLARNIKKCAGLSSIEKHHFFNGDKDSLKAWNDFKNELSQQDFSEKEQEEALEKAKDTFRFFREVFRMERTVLHS
ncbi:heme oxygenase [Salinimicrobium catena]|uniref:Heme oxygenase n=1 Tax=Salinimicrobium catena TaxID=390640 RepID=A0A1H5N357_9FLAO|nr:biliverdin-producing heme oxygenase [Salinimicrobium catena]SDL34313.1 heme oxygenase [Salinimicrobium catena]SEE95311.1 heme oxygenase [Salinimicrobium catena]